eukprot:GHVO01070037.1.p1 GENE.GHVO01070037.1~~GHVO01070037.1.p1  ORF type:complete len:302 (+),score=43.97 GHVO01070037.1:48-953(+)
MNFRRSLSLIVVGVVAVVLCIILFILSWGALGYNQIGLNYNYILQTVQNSTYTSGRYFIGFGHTFIKYPLSYQTILFGKEHGASADTLRSRTSDGLEVSLEISFQYSLTPIALYDLYRLYGSNDDAHAIFTRMAQDLLTELATKYTAYDFFVNPTLIRDEMERESDQLFRMLSDCSVDFFQLQTVELPEIFQLAIQDTEVQKQEIKISEAEQEKVTVELNTKVIQAERQAKAYIEKALGDAKSIYLQNVADIEAFRRTQILRADAYSSILSQLGDNHTDLMEYIVAQTIRDHTSKELVISL